MSFGKRLKFYRNKAGLNQSQLALKALVTRGTISNYESGMRTPDYKMIEKLSRALSIDSNLLKWSFSYWIIISFNFSYSIENIVANLCREFNYSDDMFLSVINEYDEFPIETQKELINILYSKYRESFQTLYDSVIFLGTVYAPIEIKNYMLLLIKDDKSFALPNNIKFESGIITIDESDEYNSQRINIPPSLARGSDSIDILRIQLTMLKLYNSKLDTPIFLDYLEDKVYECLKNEISYLESINFDMNLFDTYNNKR